MSPYDVERISPWDIAYTQYFSVTRNGAPICRTYTEEMARDIQRGLELLEFARTLTPPSAPDAP